MNINIKFILGSQVFNLLLIGIWHYLIYENNYVNNIIDLWEYLIIMMIGIFIFFFLTVLLFYKLLLNYSKPNYINSFFFIIKIEFFVINILLPIMLFIQSIIINKQDKYSNIGYLLYDCALTMLLCGIQTLIIIISKKYITEIIITHYILHTYYLFTYSINQIIPLFFITINLLFNHMLYLNYKRRKVKELCDDEIV